MSVSALGGGEDRAAIGGRSPAVRSGVGTGDSLQLSAELRARIRAQLERPFWLMMEAVEYRLDVIEPYGIEHYDLVPVAEYQRIRIYVSDVDRIRSVLGGSGEWLAYVSFIGKHRDGVAEAVEVVDRALIGASPRTSPILGYFSLQDPHLAWVNLVLFADLEALGSWVQATKHADDWATAASFFTAIEKSVGTLRYTGAAIELNPQRVVARNYQTSTP